MRRIFVTTDAHRCDGCFREPLNAARAFRADWLIRGGNITGRFPAQTVDRPDATERCTTVVWTSG